VKLDMSRRELGELEKRWNMVEPTEESDATGWSIEKEQVSEEALCRAKDDRIRCAQVRCLPSP